MNHIRLSAFILCTIITLNLCACNEVADTRVMKSDESVGQEEPAKELEQASSEAENTASEEETYEPVAEEPESNETQDNSNMVEDGDFSQGLEKWSTYIEGGNAQIVYENESLNTDIEGLGSVEHGVQLYYDGISLEKGCKYEIQFDASSTIERQVQYRTQINGGDYHAYNQEYLTLTPEMQHFDITFTMEEDSDPAPRLCFNMGLINDNDLDKHRVTFDNFEYYCIDDSNRSDSSSEEETIKIHINQVGYKVSDKKYAVFSSDDIDDKFQIKDAKSGKVVYDGTVNKPAVNDNTGMNEARGDFTDFKIAGTYIITSDKCGKSYEFTIGDDVYSDIFNESLKMLYLQRCGAALDKKYAGDFAHEKCHTQNATIYGTSEKIDLSGGWHDAGDYGRYTVAAAKAAADMMLAYSMYPDAFNDNAGIPESNNNIPDILDEVRYELEWMMKMQASDGGVYHKVTGLNFPGTIMPEEETAELYVLPVSTTATGDFAAAMAMAHEVYKPVDSKFAKLCLEKSEKAAKYLDNHSKESYTNPKDVVTGEYPDEFDTDERFWAYAQLYKATGNVEYKKSAEAIRLSEMKCGLGWGDVAYYGMYAYLKSAASQDAYYKSVADKMKECVDGILNNIDKDTYGCSVYGEYVWGSNMIIANNGMLLYMYSDVSGKDYKKEAKMQLDYLLGNNGLNYCYVTGFGSKSPVSIHHRVSQSLNKTIPGMLVGGANSNLEDPYAKAVLDGKAPALCYVDNSQSYSCNEVTIYWNSPLIYLLASVSK